MEKEKETEKKTPRFQLHGLEVSNRDGFYATNNRRPGYISFKIGRNEYGNVYTDIKFSEFMEMAENFKESEAMRNPQ